MVLFPKVGRKQWKVRLGWWLMVGLLCFGVLTHLFPFYVMIVTSVTPAAETMATTPTLWTFHPTLAAIETMGIEMISVTAVIKNEFQK
jgi:ABC-type glycerol-3-phosphate transport system permease component